MKRIKSFAAFVCGIVLIIFGAALLLWRGLGIQDSLRTVLGVEIVLIGIAGLLSSFSYEASNDDRKHPSDERSADIRMRAKAWSFDIVTFLILVTPPLLELFDVIDSQTHAIVGVALYGILAISWLIKAALLIFYERNL